MGWGGGEREVGDGRGRWEREGWGVGEGRVGCERGRGGVWERERCVRGRGGVWEREGWGVVE